MRQTSCQSIRTHGRLTPRAPRIAKTKTSASGLRQALLGRLRFGKTLSLGYVRRQKAGVAKPPDSDHHMDHLNRLRAKISAEFNSCLLGPQRLKHSRHFDVARGTKIPLRTYAGRRAVLEVGAGGAMAPDPALVPRRASHEVHQSGWRIRTET